MLLITNIKGLRCRTNNATTAENGRRLPTVRIHSQSILMFATNYYIPEALVLLASQLVPHVGSLPARAKHAAAFLAQ